MPAAAGRQADRAWGRCPSRLTPIFRDRHELAASSDLGRRNRGRARRVALPDRAVLARRGRVALDQRGNRLLQEVARRRARAGRDRRRRAVGQRRCRGARRRNASRRRCATHYDRRGRATGKRAEPIAADLRDGRRAADGAAQDGRGDARASGSTIWSGARRSGGRGGIDADRRGVDRRDARDQRRWPTPRSRSATRRATSGARPRGWSASCWGICATKLEPIGRLDVLDAVGARALAYLRKAGQERACPTRRWRSDRRR